MTRWCTYLICGVFFVVGLAACTEESAPQPQPQPQKAVAKPPAKQVTPPEVKEEEKEKKPEFAYIAEGRRDPFVPLTSIRRPIKASKEPSTPLETYDIPQYQLIGLIVGRGEPKAMVVAPDGKSYVLAKGIKVGKNNGVVIDITNEAITVEEKYYDFSGNVIENIQKITVPKREGV